MISPQQEARVKTITVVKLSAGKFRACLKDHPEIWGEGQDIVSAVGQCVAVNREEFGIILDLREEQEKP